MFLIELNSISISTTTYHDNHLFDSNNVLIRLGYDTNCIIFGCHSTSIGRTYTKVTSLMHSSTKTNKLILREIDNSSSIYLSKISL